MLVHQRTAMKGISDRAWKGAGQCVDRRGLVKFPVAWKRLPIMLKSYSTGHRVPVWYISLQSQSEPQKVCSIRFRLKGSVVAEGQLVSWTQQSFAKSWQWGRCHTWFLPFLCLTSRLKPHDGVGLSVEPLIFGEMLSKLSAKERQWGIMRVQPSACHRAFCVISCPRFERPNMKLWVTSMQRAGGLC